jgi:hypothetical protein
MCNRDECELPLIAVPHIETSPIRQGSPLTILSAWLAYYHRNIAPITSPVWGWSSDNDVDTSNHLSGTAIDINAPQWPWGTRTMPAHLKDKIRHGLQLFEGTVFWGADWSRPDEMHFQMNFREGESHNALFSDKLLSGYLGLYNHDEDIEMTHDELKSIIFDCLKVYVGPMVSDVKDIRQQLTGGRDLIHRADGSVDVPASYPGWPAILGTKPDGTGRTVTDAIGVLVTPETGV